MEAAKYSEQQPSLASEALQPLDPSIVKVWAIKSMLGLAIIIVAVLVFELVQFVRDSATLPFLTTFIAIVVVGAIVYFIPKLKYRFWRYQLRDQELFLERGIFNRVRTIVPLRRIQHLDISQDIIEKEFSLGKLIVHTAGTRSSDVVLPGLHIDVAEHLRDTMKDYILEDTI